MAREETIQIKIDKKNAESSIKALKQEAEALKKTFASIKVSDTSKAATAQANTEKAMANAVLATAKAQKEAANAETARLKSVKELENATKAHLSAQKEAHSLLAAQAKTEKEAANAKAAMAKAEKASIQTKSAALRLVNQENAAVEKSARAYRQLGESIGSVNKANATSLQSVAQFIHQQQGLENATVKATGAVHNSSGTFQTYKASVQNANGTMQNFKVSVNTATGEVYSLDKGITSVSGSLGKMAQSAWSTMKQIVGFTGVAQSLRYAFTEMKSMSDEMVTYRKVTGATAQEMEQIRSASYDIAKKYGQTPSDFLKAASEMARAGYGANSVAMAELATKTQLVGDMTAEMASKFLLTVDAGYKYRGSIEELTAVLDAANEIDNNYATSIEKIGEGMTLIASLGGQAGVPIEQLIAALGTLTAATQRSGAEMARGLRSIFLNVLKDTSTEIEEGVTVTEENIEGLTDALAHYAPEVVKAANATGKLINPMEAIGALAKAYKEGLFTEQELFAMSKDIAGQRYYNAFAALIENYDGMYQSMLETISGSAGSAQKEVDNMLDSWSVKFEQLKTQFVELVNTSIQEGFIKDLLDGGTAALEFAGSLENLAMMAGGAYEAIQSLSAGIKNLRMGNAFGGFNLASMGVSLGIAVIGAVKSAYEKNMRDMQEAAKKSVENAVKQTATSQSIESITQKYVQIVSDGIQEESGDLEQLKTLQSELNGLIGDQAGAIDIVNGKYDDTLTALKKLTKEQREAALATALAAKTEAVNAFNSTKINGYNDFTIAGWSGTGIGLGGFNSDFLKIPFISDWLNNNEFFRASSGLTDVGVFDYQRALTFAKPTEAEKIVQFYESLKDAYEKMGSLNPSGELAVNGEKTVGAIYSNTYKALGNFLRDVENVALPVKTALENEKSLLEGVKEVTETTETTENASKSVEDLSKSFEGLTKSIENTISAKNAFDEAMKSSKADGMKAYNEAFETLTKEIKEGRVNSTAFYASARMLMGDAAYYATGGVSQNVMAALNRKGGSGSMLEAEKILNQIYENKEGTEIEGFGIYRLLEQTKGLGRSLVDSKGNWIVPDLTDSEIDYISKAWGGLSKDLIIQYLNSLDQSDIYGRATNASLLPTPPEAESAKSPEAAVEDLGTASETTSDQIAQLGEAAASAALKIDPNVLAGRTSGGDIGEGGAEGYGNATEEAFLNGRVGGNTLGADIGVEQGYGKETGGSVNIARFHHAGLGREAEFTTDTVKVAPEDPWTDEQKQSVLDKLSKEAQDAIEDATVEGIGDAVKNQQTWEMPPIDLELNPEPAEKTVEEVADKAEETIGEPAKKKFSDYENSIQQMTALKEELQSNGMQLEEAMQSLGTNWEEVTAAFIDFQKRSGNGNNAFEPEVSTENMEDQIEQFFQEWTGQEIIFGLNANPDEAVRVANSTVQQINQKSATIKINGKFTGIGGVGGIHLAKGTKSHEGGAAFVNDGAGPELIVQNGRAFIAGGGKPALVSLEKGAKVFTASETRNILYGSGAPAYAFGTRGSAVMMTDSGGGGSIGKTGIGSVIGGEKPGDITIRKDKDDKASEEKAKSSGGSSGGGSSDKKENNDAFAKLKEIIDYILNRIGIALDEQVDIIDKQIDELRAQRERQNQQNELEEKQKAVAEAQKDLADAMNERTVRYLGSDGKWHWMADARNVQSAQERLDKAQQDLAEYRDEMAFNAQIEALENQKKALQDEYNGITKTWNDIQTAVGTPTGTVGEAISNVMAFGTDQEKKGASTVQSLLLSMMGGGSYAGNYNEALDALAQATAGSPIMPGEGVESLASLIARSGMYGGSVTDAMIDRASPLMAGASYGGATGIGSQTVYNYYVDGMKIGADKADQPLSTILRDLSVYTNSAVS